MKLTEVSPAHAARCLEGLQALDPAGMVRDAQDIVAGGRCFQLQGDRSTAVYVLTVQNGVAWVQAAAGNGPIDWTAVLDETITQQAAGLRALGCQTARPGLVRRLQRRGWRISGWVLRKELE